MKDLMVFMVGVTFNRVFHKVLSSIIILFGFGNHFSQVISIFLRDCSIAVVVDGLSSDEYNLNAAIPQECVLFPSLFLITLSVLLPILSTH